jgi:hypothetical protein
MVKKIQLKMPHNFTGLNAKHENFRKGVFIDPYDEPTYLTFALDFNFEEIPVPDPTSEAALLNSPLFNTGSQSSAINFLISRGFNPQADGLTTFREILRYLTFQAPWYFQSIQGLKELYAQSTDQSKGFKTKDIAIEVNTLEAIDLRIFELAGLYRNAIFDNKYRRERVPDNLRWFSMDIYIAEFRNIRYRLPGVGQNAANVLGINTAAIGNVIGGGNILSNVMEQFGFIKFSCRQCEFDFSNTLPIGRSVDIGSGNRKAEENSFKIKIGWVEEEAKFGDGTRLYEDPLKTDIRNPWGTRNVGTTVENVGSFLSGLPVIGDPLASAGQKVMDNLSKVGGLINPALQAASNFIDNPVVKLSDIYGTGYESNGDTKPKWNTPNSGNVY